MSIGWLGLDADAWANVIALVTGAGVVVGGMYTVRATAKQNREARAAERNADREAELRTQSRTALANVIEAADAWGEVYWAEPKEDQTGVEALAERHGELNRVVSRITSATALVHEKEARDVLVLGLRGYSLAFWMHKGEQGAELLEGARREVLVRRIGDLAAARLREDEEEQNRLSEEITRMHNEHMKAALDLNRGSRK